MQVLLSGEAHLLPKGRALCGALEHPVVVAARSMFIEVNACLRKGATPGVYSTRRTDQYLFTNCLARPAIGAARLAHA
jgi:hypothetical protein